MARTDIVVERRFQQRDLDRETVERYAEVYRSHPERMPPLEIIDVDGCPYLVDGYHRHAALVIVGLEHATVDVSSGELADAYAAAAHANANHGRARTKKDYARCVTMAVESVARMSDAKWKLRKATFERKTDGWSLKLLGDIADVNHSTVSTYLDGAIAELTPSARRRFLARENGRGKKIRAGMERAAMIRRDEETRERARRFEEWRASHPQPPTLLQPNGDAAADMRIVRDHVMQHYEVPSTPEQLRRSLSIEAGADLSHMMQMAYAVELFNNTALTPERAVEAWAQYDFPRKEESLSEFFRRLAHILITWAEAVDPFVAKQDESRGNMTPFPGKRVTA